MIHSFAYPLFITVLSCIGTENSDFALAFIDFRSANASANHNIVEAGSVLYVETPK
jgi:hypothetical protein